MKLFSKLPNSLNGLLVVMGVLAPLLMLGAATNPQMIALWTTLYIAIGAIAGLGVFLFERSQRSKAEEFSKSVETNAASAEGVKDPQKIAQIDHMRKEFQRGIDIYRKHGKDLYSLPWYVVVGESESGKTEMLRRSEIGFPDKLQDRWQGSGGTLSMHWWFTNKAVILDTAGRLFVSEGGDAGQNQWTNFLQMLKKNRPDCPINGLILVIPSNRLLTHPNPEIEAARAAELDRNAGQIAKQMETLQAELGVRFPVYILITKMDKLNGFREFFGKIDKPEDRYQMLGWSNPAPLGSPFDPQSVAEYIRSVADRLNRRMMSELRNLEPENPRGLRIDEVDGLYAFPSSFESMSGKLTRYLRHIFTTDEWSAKPPFLRGIYFTSALQQGMVLDEALAAAMGVPFERMDSGAEDDGLSLSRNRTYFVRDLFLDKIFSEKGLVTTAGKIKSAISGWKLWGPAFILLMFALFGIIGLWAMKKNDEARKWTRLWATDPGTKDSILPLATWDDSAIRPAKPSEAAVLLEILTDLGTDVQGKPKFGWVFAPAQLADRKLATDRQLLYADLVAETLFKVENAIIEKLRAEATAPEGISKWQKEEWETLHSLILLHHGTWDPAKKTVALPDAPEAAWPSVKLIKVLFSYAGLKSERRDAKPLETLLDDSIYAALSLPKSTFQTRLAAYRGDERGKLIAKVLPHEQLQQQQEHVARLNEFQRDLKQAKPGDTATIDRLAATAATVGRLPQPPQAPGAATADAKRLATDRESLLAAIVAHESTANGLGYVDLANEELSPGAGALLANDGTLLKEIAATFELIKSTPSIKLNASNIDSFAGTPAATQPASPGDDVAEALKKETAEITKKLMELKQAWFKQEFFPKHLHAYLRLPIARDAAVGSNEELLTLWKICTLAEKWGVETQRARQLIAVFTCFFETSKITTSDILGTIRPCQITLVRLANMSVAKYVVKADGQQIAEFNLMAADLKPAPLRIDRPLTFHKDSAADGSLQPWALVTKIDLGQQYPWRYITPSGTAYDLTIKEMSLDALRQWPTTADFKPKP
jgi:hypothetical protein